MEAITESISLDIDDDVAVLTIDNPPVNALSSHVRAGIFAGIQRAEQSEATATVLLCSGRTFIAGADITEFGGGAGGPSLQDAQDAMENCSKPVIASIHGTALGGGLEVALCAHFRVAIESARFGLPEVNLGLLPGAGGTQRLPRVTGVEKALDMMTSGDQIGTDEALACGLIDEVVGDLRAGAVAFARTVVAEGRELTRIRDRRDKLDTADPAVFDAVRAKIARKTRGYLAPEYNIRCIEAAVAGPTFEDGMAVEGRLFAELFRGTQSRAQQYYFFAERTARKIPDVPRDTPEIPISSAGIIGAGTMGGGIAMNFANAGIPVTIIDRDQAALDRGLGVVRENYERSASRGSIPPEAVDERMALISGATEVDALGDADVLVEAVFEDMDLKKSIFEDLDRVAKDGAILATNTSALDVNVIASATGRPESVIGLHFFSPANVMKMLEVVRGDATSTSVIATSMSLGKTIGKTPVLVGVCNGFVGNRMLFQRGIEANALLLDGATPAQVDGVLFDFGFAMGPFAMSDLAGLDIGWKPERSTSATIRELLCESGRFGQKNGRGYYCYDPDTREATPDPEVEQMIRDFASSRGATPRQVTDDEVRERLLYPMVNEGAKILEEGIAIRGSDIDVVWINGYNWPKYTGGPMFWADTVGLAEIDAKVRHYADTLGGRHWEPSSLLGELASGGGALSQHQAG